MRDDTFTVAVIIRQGARQTISQFTTEIIALAESLDAIGEGFYANEIARALTDRALATEAFVSCKILGVKHEGITGVVGRIGRVVRLWRRIRGM